jgi:hypothetical protein
LYQQADYRIQAEPVCRHLPVDLTVPPVCRSGATDRSETRRLLGIVPGTPVVLVTMGGTPVTYTFLNRLRRERQICFLLPGIGAEMKQEGNLVTLSARSRLRHPDLIAAADVVVGKVGYSTLAEVYHAGVPFGFVQRPDFPESRPLADYIRAKMPSLEIPPRDFEAGRWIQSLRPLLSLPRQSPGRPNGADRIAEFLCQRILSGIRAADGGSEPL